MINEDLHIKLNGDENEKTMFVIKKILSPINFPRSMTMDKKIQVQKIRKMKKLGPNWVYMSRTNIRFQPNPILTLHFGNKFIKKKVSTKIDQL